MAQTLEYQIKGTSDVEATTSQASNSLSNMERQLDGINRKFSNFGKDLFLSFAAPMVILNTAISAISNAIAENKQRIDDSIKFAEDSNSIFLSDQTKFLAKEQAEQRRIEEEREKALLADRETQMRFLEQDPRGREIASKARDEIDKANAGFSDVGPTSVPTSIIVGMKSVQDAIRELVETDIENARLFEQGMQEELPTTEQMDAIKKSSAPGALSDNVFSTIAGVGQHSSMDILNSQLAEAAKQTALLERIVELRTFQGDFTKGVDTSAFGSIGNIV